MPLCEAVRDGGGAVGYHLPTHLFPFLPVSHPDFLGTEEVAQIYVYSNKAASLTLTPPIPSDYPKSGHFERSGRLSYLILKKKSVKITMLSAALNARRLLKAQRWANQVSQSLLRRSLHPSLPRTQPLRLIPARQRTTATGTRIVLRLRVDYAPRGATSPCTGITPVTIFPTVANTNPRPFDNSSSSSRRSDLVCLNARIAFAWRLCLLTWKREAPL